MRTVALICIAIMGSGKYVPPDRETQALTTAVLGCRDLTTINFKSPYIPAPTRIRLDSIPSVAEAMYFELERLTAPPADIPQERNYWYISKGNRHVMMKLGDGARGVWLDVIPEANGNRMYGRADAGATVRATRISCPS